MTDTKRTTQGLRYAIVGLGAMGLRHIEAAQSIGMSFVAGVDTRAVACAAAVDRFDLPPESCTGDFDAMLDSTRPEALVIATTAPSHADLVLKAAMARVKYILCEKPLASSIAQSKAMLAACEASGTVLAVNHQQRFLDHYTRVRDLVGSPELGQVVSIVVAGSNFGLAMVASHYFEMFRFVTGKHVTSVNAWLEQAAVANPRGAEFRDASGRVLGRSDDGTTMFLDLSANAGWGIKVVFVCQHGQVTLDEFQNTLTATYRKAEHRDLPTTRYAMPTDTVQISLPPKNIVASSAAVWQAMLAGKGYPDGAIGAYTLRCLVAAHCSHRAGGREMQIDDPSLPNDEVFPWA